MKKTAILLILVMMISLLPALSVSAADEYYLKGLYEGATVVIQHERTKTVTLVDAALNGKIDPGTSNSKPPILDATATNVSKVVFTLNDNAPVTVSGATLSYTMTFDDIGTQTLKYDVYKTGNSTDTPDESKTITFNVVSGKLSAASFTQDFESVTQANLAKSIVANDGQNATASLASALSLGTWKNSNALTITKANVSSNTTHLQFRGADARSGQKVHYYEFKVGMSGQYNTKFGVAADFSSASTNDELFMNKQLHVYRSSGVKIGIMLDYNANVAVVSFNDKEWKQVPLTTTAAADNPVLVMSFDKRMSDTPYIDDFKYVTYDAVPTPTFTAASIPGGDKPVLETLSEVRFTGSSTYLDGQDAADFVTLTERANDSAGSFTESSIDYTAAIDGSDIVVTFNEQLALATTYKVSIGGIKDEYLMTYADYSFTFRTLNEGENPLPEVSLLSPEAETRFYPNESEITLSADATDTLGGTIAYVEFYVDGVLIEGSKQTTPTEGNTYTYTWVPDGSIDKAEPVAITAKAVDNEGGESETAAVNVTIYSRQTPDVTITSPTQDQAYCSSLAGVAIDVKPTIEFVAEDIDGTISAITVYVDGESVATPDTAATSYTLTESLTAGDHTIIVEVFDDDGQIKTDSVSVKVEDKGKAGYILNENYAAEDLFAKWNKSGDATFDYKDKDNGDYTIVIKSGSGTANHAIIHNLTGTSFAADIKVAFSDTATKRTVQLGDAVLVTFNTDGTYDGTEVTDCPYLAGEVYNISAVVDAENGKVYALVNGTQVGSASGTYTLNPKIAITHEGAGETAIIAASASLIGNAVTPDVDVTDNKITVTFDAGVDVSTLDGNVSMIDTVSGEAVSLIYADGVFTINEALKYDTAYEVSVLPDVRDINGAGYSGTYKYSHVTAEPATVGVADIVAGGVSLVDGTYSATLTVDFNGADKVGKTVYLIYAAFDGSKMVSYDKQAITVDTEAATPAITLTGVGADTVIEAFVVDNMDDLNAVSDRIFVIK